MHPKQWTRSSRAKTIWERLNGLNYTERESAAISILAIFLSPSSRSYVVLPLGSLFAEFLMHWVDWYRSNCLIKVNYRKTMVSLHFLSWPKKILPEFCNRNWQDDSGKNMAQISCNNFCSWSFLTHKSWSTMINFRRKSLAYSFCVKNGLFWRSKDFR